MKKRYIIIPVVALSLAVIIGIFTTLFTTPVSRYLCNADSYSSYVNDDGSVIQEADDYFYESKKVGKIMQIAYKLNPSMENLETLSEAIYNPFIYIQGKYKGNTPPNDYLKNSVKYWGIRYNTKEYDERESTFAIPSSSENKFLIFYINTLLNGKYYAEALYLDGQVEKSQDLIDEIIEQLKSEELKYSYLTVFKEYFYLVYSTTQNVTVKQWVLEKEAYLGDLFKDDETTQSFIEQHGFLFSNPDYKTYASGYQNWPDYVDIEEEP